VFLCKPSYPKEVGTNKISATAMRFQKRSTLPSDSKEAAVKYATADAQILATKGQLLQVLVSGVSAVVSAAFLGLPAKLGCICPRI
jgi:hypothetical protein